MNKLKNKKIKIDVLTNRKLKNKYVNKEILINRSKFDYKMKFDFRYYDNVFVCQSMDNLNEYMNVYQFLKKNKVDKCYVLLPDGICVKRKLVKFSKIMFLYTIFINFFIEKLKIIQKINN